MKQTELYSSPSIYSNFALYGGIFIILGILFTGAVAIKLPVLLQFY